MIFAAILTLSFVILPNFLIVFITVLLVKSIESTALNIVANVFMTIYLALKAFLLLLPLPGQTVSQNNDLVPLSPTLWKTPYDKVCPIAWRHKNPPP